MYLIYYTPKVEGKKKVVCSQGTSIINNPHIGTHHIALIGILPLMEMGHIPQVIPYNTPEGSSRSCAAGQESPDSSL